MTTLVDVNAVEIDTSIQCRAAINTKVVNEYAARMAAGDQFPPIDVYGCARRCWIGDGWHRVFAARQLGATVISAELHDGGRIDALRAALGANTAHGHLRTNADKRRSVEIALREFQTLSARQIAELCGVSAGLVDGIRPEVLPTVGNATVTTKDGRQYPAKRGKKRLLDTPTSGDLSVLEARRAAAIPDCAPGLIKKRPKRVDTQTIERLLLVMQGAVSGIDDVDFAALVGHPSVESWRDGLLGIIQKLRQAAKALQKSEGT